MSQSPEIGSRTRTRAIMEKYGIRTKKSFGQNFLTDLNVLNNIVTAADITKDDNVIEIGPGIGALTEQLAQAAQAKGIALTVEPLDGQAAFDPRWTGEALCNVVDNAVKYTPAGGRVTISAQLLDSFCRVDVADTGPGIPEGEQGAVFDRFYRGAGTRSADGLGLGLYLAREILSKQGGYIKVASRPGEGSTFSLYLPRAAGSKVPGRT